MVKRSISSHFAKQKLPRQSQHPVLRTGKWDNMGNALITILRVISFDAYVNSSHQYGHLQTLDRFAGPVVCQPGELPTENSPTVPSIGWTDDTRAK